MAPKNAQLRGSLPISKHHFDSAYLSWISISTLKWLSESVFQQFWSKEWSICNNAINHGLKICCCYSEVLGGIFLTRSIYHQYTSPLKNGCTKRNTVIFSRVFWGVTGYSIFVKPWSYMCGICVCVFFPNIPFWIFFFIIHSVTWKLITDKSSGKVNHGHNHLFANCENQMWGSNQDVCGVLSLFLLYLIFF